MVQVMGYVLCTSSGINLHVSKVAVREDCRRMGVGRALMQARACALMQARACVRPPSCSCKACGMRLVACGWWLLHCIYRWAALHMPAGGAATGHKHEHEHGPARSASSCYARI